MACIRLWWRKFFCRWNRDREFFAWAEASRWLPAGRLGQAWFRKHDGCRRATGMDAGSERLLFGATGGLAVVGKAVLISLLAVGGASMGAGADDGGWRLDANMAVPEVTEEGIAWYDPGQAPFRIGGFPWYAQDKVFRRLPVSPSHPLPSAVDKLADCTAGGTVAFRSTSSRVLVKVVLTSKSDGMFHMAPTGKSGFDLYVGAPGMQKTAGVTMMGEGVTEYQAQLFSGGQDWNEFTLNFPLYNGVKSLRIGLAEGAKVAPPSPYAGPGKVIIYGGSTVQGACASRPGRYHMSIVGRRLNREVVNLGFSGNGKLEPELAEVMAQIAAPAILIVEGERNARYEGVVERLEAFLRILRRRHPGVPMVVMSANRRGSEWRVPGDRPRILAFQQDLVAWLRAQDPDLHLFDSTSLLGDDFYECSVDGSHPTDLGFQRMADGLAPFLAGLLKPGT